MMRKTNEGPSPAGILLPAAMAGLLLTLILMLLGAVLVQRGTISEGLIAPLAYVFFALGEMLAGLLAAKRAPGGKLLWAVGAGVPVFLILLAGGAVALHQPVHIVRTAATLAVALAASAVGGVAGAGMRKKKRYHHLKK